MQILSRQAVCYANTAVTLILSSQETRCILINIPGSHTALIHGIVCTLNLFSLALVVSSRCIATILLIKTSERKYIYRIYSNKYPTLN